MVSKVKSDIKLKKLVKFLLSRYDEYFDKSKFTWNSVSYGNNYTEYVLYYCGKQILVKSSISGGRGFNPKFKNVAISATVTYRFTHEYFWEFEEYIGDSDLCEKVFLKWISINNI
jgi:hypothetical protein